MHPSASRRLCGTPSGLPLVLSTRCLPAYLTPPMPVYPGHIPFLEEIESRTCLRVEIDVRI
jgi:hypothetical protein